MSVPEGQELIECQWKWTRVSASTYASEQCQIEQAALHLAVKVDHPEQEVTVDHSPVKDTLNLLVLYWINMTQDIN